MVLCDISFYLLWFIFAKNGFAGCGLRGTFRGFACSRFSPGPLTDSSSHNRILLFGLILGILNLLALLGIAGDGHSLPVTIGVQVFRV